jgi:hypothetical protein
VAAPTSWDEFVAQREIGLRTGRDEIAFGTLDDFAREVLVRGDSLFVRVGEPGDHHIEPLVEFVVIARSHVDVRGRERQRVDGQRSPQHVFEGDQPVATSGQHRADLGVGQFGELHLSRRRARRVRRLDLVERHVARHPAKAETDDLVERCTVLSEAGEAPATGVTKARSGCRRSAASVPEEISRASARSMRCANSIPQNSGFT